MPNTGISTTLAAIDSTAITTLIYQTLLDRTPEANGLMYWDGQLEAGIPSNTVVNAFLNSTEYHSMFDSLTNEQIVNKLYDNALGRAPDAAGFAFWKGQLDAGHSPAELATYFVNSKEVQDYNANGVARVVDMALKGQVGDSTTMDINNLPSTVIVTVPGPTVYVPQPYPVPTEPTHQVSYVTNGTLDITSTKGFASAEQPFGAGNLATNFQLANDATDNTQMGLHAHYNTGDAVQAVNVGGVLTFNMEAGNRNGIHNENGINVNRSHASIDFLMNSGTDTAKTGEYLLRVDTDPTAAKAFTTFSLATDGVNYAFVNSNNVPVLGPLTVANGGHVLNDSLNFGYSTINLPHGPAGTGDILLGDYAVDLVHVVGGVEVATIHTSFHLV
jgi:hypothetical protein